MTTVKVGQVWTSTDGRPSPLVVREVANGFARVSTPDGKRPRNISIERLTGRGYRLLADAPSDAQTPVVGNAQVPNPSPLAKVREALEAARREAASAGMRGLSSHCNSALYTLAPLEKALPELMKARHLCVCLDHHRSEMEMVPIAWQNCPRCKAMLEGT